MPDQGENIFTTPKTDDNGNPIVVAPENPFADKLGSIMGTDGKPKYDDVNSALDALGHSQTHIKTLETERNADRAEIIKLREQIAQHATVEDVVKRLTDNQAKPSTTPTSEPPAGLDEKKVEELIRQTLTTRTNEVKHRENLSTVIQTLSTKFGDKANEQVNLKAAELGTTSAALQEMAKENPTMVLALFGEAIKPSSTPTQSSVLPNLTPNDNNPKPKFEKSILAGATNAQLMEAWGKVGQYTHKRLGVEKLTE